MSGRKEQSFKTNILCKHCGGILETKFDQWVCGTLVFEVEPCDSCGYWFGAEEMDKVVEKIAEDIVTDVECRFGNAFADNGDTSEDHDRDYIKRLYKGMIQSALDM